MPAAVRIVYGVFWGTVRQECLDKILILSEVHLMAGFAPIPNLL
jgi:hypothetical protein